MKPNNEVRSETASKRLQRNTLKPDFGKQLQRTFMSGNHLQSAAIMARNATRLESAPRAAPDWMIEHLAYTTGAIMLSVSFLEAAINELFEASLDEFNHTEYFVSNKLGQRKSKFASAWTRNSKPVESKAILGKYKCALMLADVPGFKEKEHPWTTTDLLIQFRNDLTHWRPSWQPVCGESSLNFVNQLEGKFAVHPLSSSDAKTYPWKFLSSGSAHWSLQTAITFSAEAFNKLGLEPRWKPSANVEPILHSEVCSGLVPKK